MLQDVAPTNVVDKTVKIETYHEPKGLSDLAVSKVNVVDKTIKIETENRPKGLSDPVVSKVDQNKKKKQGSKEENNEDGSGKDKFSSLIFMCNSQTKKECFRYKVFGLPPTKKELVEKVKPGMKLFLYDFNLRQMYGIYKTASVRAMNVEPNAFRSCKRPLPTQVIFLYNVSSYIHSYFGPMQFQFHIFSTSVSCFLLRLTFLNEVCRLRIV